MMPISYCVGFIISLIMKIQSLSISTLSLIEQSLFGFKLVALLLGGLFSILLIYDYKVFAVCLQLLCLKYLP